MFRRRHCIAAVCFAVAVPAAAADDTEVTRRTLTLPRGVAEIGADLEINVSVREIFEPVSIAPDVRYGVTDAFTIGLTHSFRSQSLLGAGNGLCLTGDGEGGCEDLYRGTSLDLMYATAPSGNVDSAVRMRFTARDYDPFKLSWKLGVLVRHRQGRFALVSDPHLAFGLTNTDQGNSTFFDLPVWFQVQATRSIMPYMRTGIDGVVNGFGDTYRVPLGFGVVYSFGRFDVGAELSMPEILGPQNDGKPRLLRVLFTWRPEIARRRPRAGS
jgi:hypothetical protein